MNKAFEKILERMDEASVLRANSKEYFNNPQNGEYVDDVVLMKDVIKIVNEVAKEYNGGWIPCSERLPEDGTTVLVQDFEEYYEVSICETRNGVKGFSSGDWWTSANNYIAWQPLSEPYKEV